VKYPDLEPYTIGKSRRRAYFVPVLVTCNELSLYDPVVGQVTPVGAAVTVNASESFLGRSAWWSLR
jgi:hypothetical protein